MSGVAKKMKAFAEKSSWIRKMFEEGAKMKAEFGPDKVFDFSIGNPDVPPPPKFYTVLRELAQDEQPGIHGYMPNAGYPFVREALAGRLGGEQGVSFSANDILMTCGAAGGLNVIFKALLDPGDEVIILAPFFVEYHFYIDNHGGVAKVVATDSEFNLDLKAIEAALTAKTKVVLINSPNNPTGQIYSAASLRELGRLLDTAGERFGTSIYLVSDEPYRNIVFDGNEVPALMPVTTNTIIASSYSKELSLPGERIGYLAVHPEMAEKEAVIGALTLANRILGFVNAPALMQRAVAQLQNVSAENSVYARRLEVFCKVLDEAGMSYVRPKGAFYLFPQTPIDDVEFCRLLTAEKILAVPGRGFGLPGHIRLAFCVDEKVIAGSSEGFKRAMAAATQK
ncbi:pyridoxal phosphate-dependent aminotransferase [Desulfobulbus oligotrophicus]|jgi:aspartate aminotransferase|uniref:Aminotransferase n=1 Tax=Desulfobulbus oligotrophicus TaxID=1909699 RepID=A0A7T5VF87_9BACT|nr:pyridoxal phosphate-dependent aminotransferase [Desulfobulbus oligotrophicus]MDY0389918.1 pyridoxal phosphate-dependent aminotransferase [Desulfobulbus oligotrophicus]QQG66823.1 pyridoxal phosphate-dependent aminotransferase [Desulfobulbus oligotrophicus]